MKLAHLLATTALLVGATVPYAHAGSVQDEIGPNLVTNGSFESDLSGWTTSGFFSNGFDFRVDSVGHSGSSSFAGGAIESLGFLTQNLTTRPGQAYNIDLWLASDGFLENEFQVLWNGDVVFDSKDIFPQDFSRIVIDPIATSASTTLSFGFRNDSGLLHVDDISVQAIPEPSTYALIGVSLIAMAWVRRRETRR